MCIHENTKSIAIADLDVYHEIHGSAIKHPYPPKRIKKEIKTLSSRKDAAGDERDAGEKGGGGGLQDRPAREVTGRHRVEHEAHL